MSDALQNADNLVDVVELARRLNLPWRWLEQEAEHQRIPRLVVQGPRRSKIYLFNSQAVQDHLALRAALGDKPPAREVSP